MYNNMCTLKRLNQLSLHHVLNSNIYIHCTRQVTDGDLVEESVSNGEIQNGYTLRTGMALRSVVLSYSPNGKLNENLRIVLQMSSPCPFVQASGFTGPHGNPVMIPLDLSLFLNGLLFKSASHPGLARILLTIFDMEGTAIRRRKAYNLRGINGERGYWIGKTFKEMKNAYTSSIFLGVVRPKYLDLHRMRKRGLGICPYPETIIHENDLLIFIGPSSMPHGTQTGKDLMDECANEARAIITGR